MRLLAPHDAPSAHRTNSYCFGNVLLYTLVHKADALNYGKEIDGLKAWAQRIAASIAKDQENTRSVIAEMGNHLDELNGHLTRIKKHLEG